VRAAGAKFRWVWRAMSFGILLLIYAALTSCGSNVPAAPVPQDDPSPDGDIVIKLFDEVTSKPLLEDATVRVINPQMENQASESDNDDHDKLAIHDCTQISPYLYGCRVIILSPFRVKLTNWSIRCHSGVL